MVYIPYLVWFVFVLLHMFSYLFLCLFILCVSCFIAVPEIIDGNTLTATVVDLNAWVEYEFRVLAKNSVGVGEPSPVSVKTRTEDAGTVNANHYFFPSQIIHPDQIEKHKYLRLQSANTQIV